MKYLITTIAWLLFITTFTIAQTKVDVIKLKNGDVVKGEIIKQVPGEFVKIRTLKGNTYGYMYSEIAEITEEIIPEGSMADTDKSGQHTKPVDTRSDAEKLKIYTMKKKSPATAVILSALLSSTGHGYAGNWKRGLSYALGRFSCGIFAAGAGIQKETKSSYRGTTVTYKFTTAYYVGMGGALFITILEMFDAAKTAEEYNRELYESLYPGKPFFGLRPAPTGDGFGVALSLNF